jgi:ubiquinone/menaquinone biosynthesis C-methylase UbiE
MKLIGLDPSLPMLGIASKKDLKLTVAGEAPGLPFAAKRFDAVMASLVLPHFPNYGRPGGCGYGPRAQTRWKTRLDGLSR